MARMRPSRIALAVGLLTGCSAALAEPVSIIYTVAGFWAAAGYVAATYGTYIALAYGVLQSQLASSAARRQQSAAAAQQRSQYNASLQDRNVTVMSGEAPWQAVYGNPAPVGGAIVGIFSSGNKDQYKHLIVVFASHECESIDEVYIDGDPVSGLDVNGDTITGAFFDNSPSLKTESVLFDVNGNGTLTYPATKVIAVNGALALFGTEAFYLTSPTTVNLGSTLAAPTSLVVSYASPQGTGRVNLQKHLSPGGVDYADNYLGARAGAGVYTSADALSGYTYIVLTLDLNLSRFQGGPPAITARIRGKKVYDYRTGLTAYSGNAALCLADFITSEPGFNAARSQIDSASVIAAANACDAAGFSCDGSFKTDQAREATKQQLEDSFGAFSHQSGGVWRITPGAWTTPVMAITDADLAAPIQIDQAGFLSKERFNTVRGKYVDAAGLGVSTDFTPWQNLAEVAADGLVKVRDITLPFTYTHQRTQDLARMMVERSRGGLTITYPGQMRLWPLQPGDRVSVTNAEFGFAAKTFRVIDWTFHPKTPVALVLLEDVPAYYNAAAVITADAAPNSTLPNPYAQIALNGLTAESGTNQLLRQSDGTITTRVLLRWSASTAGYVLQGGTVQIQTKLATETGDIWTPADMLPGDSVSDFLLGLADRTTYLIRARFVNQIGVTGPWNVIAHTVIGKTAPPATPAYVSLTQSLVFWGQVADLDLSGYLIRSQPGNVGIFSRGTPLHDGQITASPFTLNRKLYGIQTVMVAAIDSSGNIGGAASATLDFGQPDSNNFVQTIDYAAAGYAGVITGGTIAGTVLSATALATSDDYALADAYGEPDVYATQYNALQWTTGNDFLPAYGGGTLSLAYSATGASQVIEYAIDGDTLTNLYGLADTYAATDLYGPVSAWQAWPGALAVSRMTGVRFRVSIAGGAERPTITNFVANLSAQEQAQTFASKAIAAAGTRLSPALGTPPQNWIVLRSVQATVFVDGGGAIAGRLLDFNSVIGPLAQVVDLTGTAVSGKATFELRGLVDV
jgi:hypothetical protein